MQRDGRIALYLTDHYRLLAPPPGQAEGPLPGKLRAELRKRGASFFADLQAATGAFANDLVAALWSMVWTGEATNDTLAPLRSYLHGPPKEERRLHLGRAFRSRRLGPPGSEGRWSLLPEPKGNATERAAALAQSLLARHGIVTREAVHAEGIAGGFSAVYPVLKAMEERGRIRRGYFVAGLGGAQFALPGAVDRLRAAREGNGTALVLAATDPANPYGATLPWPARNGDSRAQRSAGAQVVLHQGDLIAWLGRGEHDLHTFLPAEEPARTRAARALAQALAALVDSGQRRALLIERVDGEDVAASPMSAHFKSAGFTAGARGYLKRAATEPPGMHSQQ